MPLTRFLALFGATPFVIGAFGPIAGFDLATQYGDLAVAALAYGLTIASFMAGVHWGTAISRTDTLPINLFVTSNVLAVVAWLVFLFLAVHLAAIALAVVFLVLLLIDWRLWKAGVINSDYWKTRFWVTVLVVVCLLLMAGQG